MSGWPLASLGDLLTEHHDWITLDPETGYKQITARLWGKGLALRGISKGADIGTHSWNRVRAGQFLISKIDARHGAFGLVPDDLDGAVVSSDFPTFDVHAAQVIPGLLKWISKTDWFVALCKRASEGSTNRVRLKEERFLAQKIPLPPLVEQCRIVAQLDGLAERIKTVTGLRAEMMTEANNLIVSANFAWSEGKILPLSEVLFLSEDRVPVTPGEEYPQVGIKGFGGGLFSKAAVPALETRYRHFNRLHEGQFVMSQVKGWEGAVAVCSSVHAGFFSSPEYRTFDCRPDRLRSTYLAHLCKSPWFHHCLSSLTRGQGARRERLRPEMLIGLRIPLPNIKKQAKLEQSFDRIELTRTQSAVGELDELLPAMLNRAFGI